MKPIAAQTQIWSPLPTRVQMQLLRLVLATSLDQEGLKAWSQAVDIRNLDDGSTRLLPSLYFRIAEAGLDHPWLAIMRGWYRRCLYRNRLLVHRGLDLVRRLEDRGIPSLLLKGCPIGTRFYADLGERPMGDFDILVPDSTPSDHVAALLTAGGSFRLRNRSLHAHTFVDRDGFEYDVHWHLQPELAFAGSSRALWGRSEAIEVQGRPLRTLSAEDHVFHVLAHGLRISNVPPLRWIVDVSKILRATPAFDWARLRDQAVLTATVVPVVAGLRFMVGAGLLAGPAEGVVAALDAVPPAMIDRILFKGQMRKPGLPFLAVRPFLLHRRLGRLSPNQGPAPDFARFLAALWDLESPRRIPAAAFGKLRERLRARTV